MQRLDQRFRTLRNCTVQRYLAALVTLEAESRDQVHKGQPRYNSLIPQKAQQAVTVAQQ